MSISLLVFRDHFIQNNEARAKWQMSTVAKPGLVSLGEGSVYCFGTTPSSWVCCDKYYCSVLGFLCLFCCGVCQAWPTSPEWGRWAECMETTLTFLFVCCPYISGYKMHYALNQFSILKNIQGSLKHLIVKWKKNRYSVIHGQHIWNVFGLVIIFTDYTFPLLTSLFLNCTHALTK